MTFWDNKQVVVTGGAGFLGSHLVEALCYRNARVTVVDNYERGSNRFPNVTYVYGDVGLEGACRDTFKDQEVVFNLAAAVAGVEYNQHHQAAMFTNNMRLQAIPLRIAAEYQVQRFVQVSSACVYAPQHNHPAYEYQGHTGTPISANAGYAWAKRMGERLAQWTKDLHTVIVRPSNLYGPRDYFDARAHVIPALIKKTLTQHKIVVNGDPKVVREFLYVADAARGLLAAAEYGATGEAYNLGCPKAKITIGELAVLIRDLADQRSKAIMYEQLFDGGDPGRYSDSSKAEQELQWQAETILPQGLHSTIEWYKEQGNV